MAKAKNKRNSGLADKVHNKRKGDVHKKKLNPFEVHINREKMKVLGQKSKHERGLPGVARARAVQKRKETLGTEMKLMHKTNVFTDRRIGEKDAALSAEERATARFAAERARRPRPALYNLADDEVLTHRGQTLEQIEKFDDPRSSDDEDDDDGRKAFRGLDDDFVAEGHFGGGVLSRPGGAGGAGDAARSHKDLIDQLIADSKRRKADKQKQKEQTLDLTEKLDSEWRDLQPVVAKRARADNTDLIEPLLTRADKSALDYDQMTRELRFEKRGTPSDGLKSVEAAAAEERQQLAAWERERDARMQGEEEEGGGGARGTGPAVPHRSAEDLDDNFELEDPAGFMLAYDAQGTPLVPAAVLTQHSGFPSEKKQFQDGVSDTSSDEDDEEEEEEDDGRQESDDDEQKPTDRASTNKEAKENETSILDKNNKSDEDKNGDDEDKDKETTDDESDDDIETEEKISDEDNNSKKLNSVQTNGLPKDDSSESDLDTEPAESEKKNVEKLDINNLKELLESEAESDDDEQIAEDNERISSFFKSMSTEGYKLKELLSDKSPAAAAAALARLVREYDPARGEGNRERLGKLFAYLLQYLHDAFRGLRGAAELARAFRTLQHLAPIAYDLAKLNKVSAMKCLVDVLKEKHDQFLKKPKKVPDLDTLIFFKLVSLIYPTSDFRHPVATPALVFMAEILKLGRFRDPYSISRGLFVTALVVEYTSRSRRLVPAAVNFLRGVLYLSANTSALHPLVLAPPFQPHRDARYLQLSADCSRLSAADKMAASDLLLQEPTDDFKIRVLSTSVSMLQEVFDYFSELEAQACLFQPHLALLARVELQLYPRALAERVQRQVAHMTRALEMKVYTPLCAERKRTKALRLYEPDVQDVFTGSKSGKLSREAAERARLTTRLRRERRGAARELRRDTAYLAGEKLRGKIHSDNVRKARVKRIYAEAALQQGELNKLKRTK